MSVDATKTALRYPIQEAETAVATPACHRGSPATTAQQLLVSTEPSMSSAAWRVPDVDDGITARIVRGSSSPRQLELAVHGALLKSSNDSKSGPAAARAAAHSTASDSAVACQRRRGVAMLRRAVRCPRRAKAARSALQSMRAAAHAQKPARQRRPTVCQFKARQASAQPPAARRKHHQLLRPRGPAVLP